MQLLRITAALIAKNEASRIGACMASLTDQVDEIVVVDTGSTDATPQIAANYGACVLHCAWLDDFAAARNVALDHASGDWILYIDADERLSVPGSQRLHYAIDPHTQAGMMVRLHPRPSHTAYHELRLFPRDDRIRFEGRIHEQILPGVRKVCAAEGKSIGTSDIALRHVGYEGDLTHKHHRNLPLLELAVQERPDRLYCWYHLGETLGELGRLDEAEAALRRGITIGKTRDDPQDVAGTSLCYQRLATIADKRGEDPRPVIIEGLQNWPDDYCLRLLAAKAEVELGDPADALAQLADLADIDASSFFDPLISYDRRTFSLWPHALMGIANLKLGRYAASEASFRRAAASADASAAERIEFTAKAEVAAGRAKALTS